MPITEVSTRSKAGKDKRIKGINEQINYISKMSIKEYLNNWRKTKKLETIFTINKKIKYDLMVKF